MGFSFSTDIPELAMTDFVKYLQGHGVVWLALLALTVCSYLLLDHWAGTEGLSKEVVVSVVAAIKVLMILHYFMELDEAPVKAKAIAYCWVVVLVVLIINMPVITSALVNLGLVVAT